MGVRGLDQVWVAVVEMPRAIWDVGIVHSTRWNRTLIAGKSDAAINYMHIEPRSVMRWMLIRREHNIS